MPKIGHLEVFDLCRYAFSPMSKREREKMDAHLGECEFCADRLVRVKIWFELGLEKIKSDGGDSFSA